MFPRVGEATWKTAVLAGQLTAWTGAASEYASAGWLGSVAVALVFFGTSIYWVGGRELVDGMLGQTRGSWSDVNRRMGAVGGRMLVWFASGATAIVIQVASRWPTSG
jgi:hypothetical protein